MAIQQRTLIDIAQSRPDVLDTAKSQGGDPFTSGTAANQWLNNWWNTSGVKEFPDVTLAQPLSELQNQTAKAREEVAKLGQPTGTITPTSGTSFQEINQDGAPVLRGDIVGVQSSVDGIVARTPTLKVIEAEKKRIDAERSKKTAGLKSLIETEKPAQLSMEDITTQALKSSGLPEDFTKKQFGQMQSIQAEVLSLNKSLSNLNLQEQQALLKIGDQAIPVDSIRGQQTQAERRFSLKKAELAIDLQFKMATIEMLQGNLDRADRAIDKAISFAVLKKRQEISDYEWMRDTYKEELESFDKKEQNLFNNFLKALKDETDATARNLKEKVNLYFDAGLAPPDMAILEGMDLAEAGQDVFENKQGELLSVAEAKSLGVPFGTTREGAFGITPTSGGGDELQASDGFFDADTEASVRENFVDLRSGFTNPGAPTEGEGIAAYNTLRALYSPQEATDVALKSLVGVSTQTQVPTAEDLAGEFLGDAGFSGAPSKPSFFSPEGVGAFLNDPFGSKARKEETKQRLIFERNEALKVGDMKKVTEIDLQLSKL